MSNPKTFTTYLRGVLSTQPEIRVTMPPHPEDGALVAGLYNSKPFVIVTFMDEPDDDNLRSMLQDIKSDFSTTHLCFIVADHLIPKKGYWEVPAWVKTLHPLHFGRIYTYRQEGERFVVGAAHLHYLTKTERVVERLADVPLMPFQMKKASGSFINLEGDYAMMLLGDSRKWWSEKMPPYERPARPADDDDGSAWWENLRRAKQTANDFRDAGGSGFNWGYSHNDQYSQRQRVEVPRQQNFYEILGVSPRDDASTIRRAYLKLVKQWHPDYNKSPEALTKMQQINDAYDRIGRK